MTDDTTLGYWNDMSDSWNVLAMAAIENNDQDTADFFLEEMDNAQYMRNELEG
jgi:hypothetical protein